MLRPANFSIGVNDYVTFEVRPNTTMKMAAWFWYAVIAAVLYGAHQIFTRLASDHIGDGLGGFVVEATAALSSFISQFFGSPGDGIKNLPPLGSIFRWSPESALAPEQSPSFCCSSAAARFR